MFKKKKKPEKWTGCVQGTVGQFSDFFIVRKVVQQTAKKRCFNSKHFLVCIDLLSMGSAILYYGLSGLLLACWLWESGWACPNMNFDFKIQFY